MTKIPKNTLKVGDRIRVSSYGMNIKDETFNQQTCPFDCGVQFEHSHPTKEMKNPVPVEDTTFDPSLTNAEEIAQEFSEGEHSGFTNTEDQNLIFRLATEIVALKERLNKLEAENEKMKKAQFEPSVIYCQWDGCTEIALTTSIYCRKHL